LLQFKGTITVHTKHFKTHAYYLDFSGFIYLCMQVQSQGCNVRNIACFQK